MIEIIFSLVVCVMFFASGMYTQYLTSIDYKKRWQNSIALLQGDDERPQLEQGNGGWIIEVETAPGTRTSDGKKCQVATCYAKRGKTRIQIPYGDDGGSLVLSGDNFVENMRDYKKRALEIAQAIDS